MQYLNTIIKNCHKLVKILFIGNNSCLIRITPHYINEIFYCPYYLELTNSSVIEDIDVNKLTDNKYTIDHVIHYLESGNSDFFDTNEQMVENASLIDRVENHIYDSISKHLKIKNSLNVFDNNKFTLKHDITIDKLIGFLDYTGGVISGGFGIRVALDDQQFGDDIDILIPTTTIDYQNLDKIFTNNFFLYHVHTK